MGSSFFFYDLETSGFDPRNDRIMQFAGQRTDLELNPIGEPVNELIALTDDVVPSPDAILVTGITPQKTRQEGYTEAEFTKLFQEQVATPGTIFIGYNTVRFDDEFMRFLLYRNFHDAYEWQWKDDRSRWDLLDVVRMTRALRPEGIKWPVDAEGKPTNRLELLSAINKLEHTDAHDALSDVRATIQLAVLLKDKQPKLFDFLLKARTKQQVAEITDSNQPFVYSSGKYASEHQKTTVAQKVADHPDSGAILVYDLRFDPDDYIKMDVSQLIEAWKYKKDSDEPRLPVKTLKFNRCPAVAPLGVLDEKSQERLNIDLQTIEKNREKLSKHKSEFAKKLREAISRMNKVRQESWLQDERSVDGALYNGFIGNNDKKVMSELVSKNHQEIENFTPNFTDERLKKLFLLYKARNFPKVLSDQEREMWEKFKQERLTGGAKPRLQQYFIRLKELGARTNLAENQRFLIEELQLYGESLMPTE